ncbi:MAG TPA: hypothetical protein VMR66_07920, partial [Gemmatimonadota bacterium]|nr:hypothetical protein [Gemmatimonadota bacterium]
ALAIARSSGSASLPMSIRSGTAAIFGGLGKLLFGAAYVASVFVSYESRGLGWAIATAIPVVGQLLWLGVMWSSVGLLNWYSFLLGGSALLFGVSRLVDEF